MVTYSRMHVRTSCSVDFRRDLTRDFRREVTRL
jgi:hypothetical protein